MSTIVTKILCTVCKKGKGTFKCEGCADIFCPKHSIDHRNDLSKQLEEIEIIHDLAYKTLIQQTQNLRQHTLIQQIDQWEYQSIDQIRRMAEEARNELLQGITEHTSDIKTKLQDLSDELRQGREENDFLEGDLQEWLRKIEEFKLELLNPINIAIEKDSTALVTKIRIDRQEIYRSIEDDSPTSIDIRGKTEYQIGNHTIHFRIERLIDHGWIAFGIISKSNTTRKNFQTSPSSYGWSNQNQIYLAGQLTNEETIEMIENDTIELTIDCDQQKIEFKNQRSDRTMELSIDINKCPFPWQYYINQQDNNIQLRILNPSD